MLILRGSSDTNTVTVNDNANTALGDHRVLGRNDTLSLLERQQLGGTGLRG